jgi:hypothetical protein
MPSFSSCVQISCTTLRTERGIALLRIGCNRHPHACRLMMRRTILRFQCCNHARSHLRPLVSSHDRSPAYHITRYTFNMVPRSKRSRCDGSRLGLGIRLIPLHRADCNNQPFVYTTVTLTFSSVPIYHIAGPSVSGKES